MHVDRRCKADQQEARRDAGPRSRGFQDCAFCGDPGDGAPPDLEVQFSTTDKASLVDGSDGAKARLPEPPRKPNPREAAIVRGLADSMALRLACHSDAVHRRLQPQSPAARALFDAVEQARVEAIGSRRMLGVSGNITAMLDDRYSRVSFAEARDRDQVPLEDAVALMVRERLTGLQPPAGASRLVELWRSHVEGRAGADLDKLDVALLDQKAFARVVQHMLVSLDLASEAEFGSGRRGLLRGRPAAARQR